MLLSIEYEDVQVVADVESGCELTGFLPHSNAFPAKLRMPCLTKEELVTESIWRNKAILGR
eukprot:2895776-Amphidinium_carterae.1